VFYILLNTCWFGEHKPPYDHPTFDIKDKDSLRRFIIEASLKDKDSQCYCALFSLLSSNVHCYAAILDVNVCDFMFSSLAS
jgi:hypothetical protein